MHGNSSYTPELAAEICLLVSEGKSLRDIASIDGMPCVATIMNWCNSEKINNEYKFLEQYMRAKEDYAEHIAEEIINIADHATNDYMVAQEDGGGIGYKLNGEAIQRSRLRIDTRKWLAGKLKPKRYGDKSIVGDNGSVSIIVNKGVED